MIATVVLVGFAVAVGVLVFLFGKQTIEAQTQKLQCDQEQINLDFNAVCTLDEEKNNSKLTLTNIGTQKIDGYRVVTEIGEVQQSPAPTMINLKPGEDFVAEYEASYDSLEIFPGIVKENDRGAQFVLCTDQVRKVSCQ